MNAAKNGSRRQLSAVRVSRDTLYEPVIEQQISTVTYGASESKRLSIGNTQISTLFLCFLYLFVELMITMCEYILFKQNDQQLLTVESLL